jgi:hypothetical protein
MVSGVSPYGVRQERALALCIRETHRSMARERARLPGQVASRRPNGARKVSEGARIDSRVRVDYRWAIHA